MKSNCLTVYVFIPLQLFDKGELLECIRKLVEVDQDWVPSAQDTSLYIRPTFIGIEVSWIVTVWSPVQLLK